MTNRTSTQVSIIASDRQDSKPRTPSTTVPNDLVHEVRTSSLAADIGIPHFESAAKAATIKSGLARTLSTTQEYLGCQCKRAKQLVMLVIAHHTR
eukprot:529716-Amphidinium_carterae.1